MAPAKEPSDPAATAGTSPTSVPERRRNALNGRWVLISANRAGRPWHDDEDSSAPTVRRAYDANCFLCPGNPRATGHRNPDYHGPFVFTNDFAALRPDARLTMRDDHPLFRAHTAVGTCRVVCYSPRHDRDLALMTAEEVRGVVDVWHEQYSELHDRYAWVQVFENRGRSMGASSPHPHGQVWATAYVPAEPRDEDAHQREWFDERGSPLLVDYSDNELRVGERIVTVNSDWLTVVPYWAAWPFETLVLPRRHMPRFTDLEDSERHSLADVLRRLLIRYDNLFAHPFPYSMGWHEAPEGAPEDRAWQLHAHYYPSLLRSASVPKFMVGYELLAEVQRDITPEDAAARLRVADETHYLLDSRRAR